MDDKLKFNEGIACEACGQFGAYEFDGRRLCAECYEKCGSCCPEFGADDLGRERDDTRTGAKDDGPRQPR